MPLIWIFINRTPLSGKSPGDEVELDLKVGLNLCDIAVKKPGAKGKVRRKNTGKLKGREKKPLQKGSPRFIWFGAIFKTKPDYNNSVEYLAYR